MSNILFEIIVEMLQQSNSGLATPIDIIFACIKELFMLVIALWTACFSRAKINKKLWPFYFECSGAGTGGAAVGEVPNIPEGLWLEERRGRGKKGKGR